MSRYKETNIQDINLMQRYRDRKGTVTKYNTTVYEEVDPHDSDLLVRSQAGDRLDLLALQFYGDRDLWWFIGRVNNIVTMNIPAGTALRIPATPESARGT